MASRKRAGLHNLPEAWRDKIRVGAIMEKLERGANGQLEMTANQLKAAQILLNKLVPDLARTELTGKDGGEIQLQTRDVTAKVLKELPEDRLRALLEEEKP